MFDGLAMRRGAFGCIARFIRAAGRRHYQQQPSDEPHRLALDLRARLFPGMIATARWRGCGRIWVELSVSVRDEGAIGSLDTVIGQADRASGGLGMVRWP